MARFLHDDGSCPISVRQFLQATSAHQHKGCALLEADLLLPTITGINLVSGCASNSRLLLCSLQLKEIISKRHSGSLAGGGQHGHNPLMPVMSLRGMRLTLFKAPVGDSDLLIGRNGSAGPQTVDDSTRQPDVLSGRCELQDAGMGAGA